MGTGPRDASHTARVVIPVRGMTCASCVAHVERSLRALNGVTSASVNLATEKAAVEYRPMAVDIGRLQASIVDAGYEAGEVERRRAGGMPPIAMSSRAPGGP